MLAPVFFRDRITSLRTCHGYPKPRQEEEEAGGGSGIERIIKGSGCQGKEGPGRSAQWVSEVDSDSVCERNCLGGLCLALASLHWAPTVPGNQTEIPYDKYTEIKLNFEMYQFSKAGDFSHPEHGQGNHKVLLFRPLQNRPTFGLKQPICFFPHFCFPWSFSV